MHTVLVPTDFSNSSRRTLDFALEIYPPDENKYILLRCKPVNQTQEILVSIDDILEKNIHEKLDAEREYIRGKTKNDSEVEVYIDSEGLDKAIHNCLKKEFIDLIVLGPCIYSGVEQNSENAQINFIERIPVSILLVPDLEDSYTLNHLLFATRLTGINTRQIAPLINLGIDGKRHISILSVGLENPFGKDIPLKLENMINGYFEGTDFTMHAVQESDPYRAITQFSEKMSCDLISIVFKPQSFVERLVRDNVSKKLLDGYKKPILMLKQ